MKHTLILLLFSCAAWGQDKAAYNFINEIGVEFTDNKEKIEYYLCKEPFPTIIYVEFYKKEIYDSLKSVFTTNELDSILLEEKKTVKSFTWDKSIITFRDVISEKEQDAAIQKAKAAKKYIQFISLTYPRFSKNKDYAFILVNQHSGGSNGSTCIYLYHFEYGKWLLKKSILCMMS